MGKPKPTRFKVGDKVFIQGMLPLDGAPAEPAVPAVPAAIAGYYGKQDEHEERERALPASMVGQGRRDMKTFFLPKDDDEE